MKDDYLLAKDGTFVIKDYNRKDPFSDFLPSVAGAWGIPLWLFYTNRGQGVASFGLNGKEHSISEFFPANKAYAFTPIFGFRTFLRVNKSNNYEPFCCHARGDLRSDMSIRSASFSIEEANRELGLTTGVRYFTLPNTPVAGLVRAVTIKNISKKTLDIEGLDGLARIIPFGSANFFLKDMTRTLEAWMRSRLQKGLALFRLVVAPEDVSQTKYIEGANFCYSFYQKKGRKVMPQIVVDPALVFGQNTSFSRPDNFFDNGIGDISRQITCGKTPCAFSHFHSRIPAQGQITFYSVYGGVFHSDVLPAFIKQIDRDFIEKKYAENESLVESLKGEIACRTGRREFDHYLKTTYLDNILRGGYPYKLADNKSYYIFSRKHGDLERDYNYFCLLPSYFSEGECNYRDINQNRRIDLFFNPDLGRTNIKYFLNLMRIDGYNPLVVRGSKIYFKPARAKAVLKEFGLENKDLIPFMCEGFYLGEIFKFIEEKNIKLKCRGKFAETLVSRGRFEPTASFGDGFWIDHWRYNLDLIENYLYFYPDNIEDLFREKEYCFWDDEHRVKPRRQRYCIKNGKVYQFKGVEAVEEKKKIIEARKSARNFLRAKDGSIYKTHLFEKILLLILNKAATIDAHGLGVEMEAGKPGWCDSLNGLPALFGSSLCETAEIKRACLILLQGLRSLYAAGMRKVEVSSETIWFLNKMSLLLEADFIRQKKNDFLWWDNSNKIKEEFRSQTFFALSGKRKSLSLKKAESFLVNLSRKLTRCIKKTKDKKSGVYPTYFRYEVKKYRTDNGRIVPLDFKRVSLPLFLEAPVNIMRLEKEKELYQALKKTDLFDSRLKMYRLNVSLEHEPLEIGRSRIFVPGWLENGTVWLHMEYKYLLEVLRGGLYDQFYRDFSNCCVCFFPPDVYGRSILENSSFIVSSVHPDKKMHGKGFVARLSGATVELVNIWMIMVLGRKPIFTDKNGDLCLRFKPLLHKDMFTTGKESFLFGGKNIVLDKNCLAFTLFSKTLVVYHNPSGKNTYVSNCSVFKIKVEDKQGKIFTCDSDNISSYLSRQVREGNINRVDVYFQ